MIIIKFYIFIYKIGLRKSDTTDIISWLNINVNWRLNNSFCYVFWIICLWKYFFIQYLINKFIFWINAIVQHNSALIWFTIKSITSSYCTEHLYIHKGCQVKTEVKVFGSKVFTGIGQKKFFQKRKAYWL